MSISRKAVVDNYILFNATTVVEHFLKQSDNFDDGASFAELYPELLDAVDYEEMALDIINRYFIDDDVQPEMADFLGLDAETATLGEMEKEASTDYREFATNFEYLDSFDDYRKEALEFYAVDSRLAELFQEMGELVAYVDELGYWVWGRTTSGRYIEHDAIIHAVSLRLS